MKIYNKIKLDIDTWKVLEEDSFDYDGPLMLCDSTSWACSIPFYVIELVNTIYSYL